MPVVVLLVLVAAPAARGDSYYVDRGPGCSDARKTAAARSPASPWCGVARAAAAVPAGSTVVLRGGRYPSTKLRSTHRATGSSTNGRAGMITYRAASAEAVEMDGLQLVGASNLRFQGLTFTGPVDVRSSQNIELIGNRLPGQRLWLQETDRVLVQGNHIHDIAADNTYKIGIRLMRDTNTVLRGNRIERLVEDPIQVTKPRNALIEGNVLLDAHPAAGEHTDSIHVLGADGLTIRSNYIRDIEHGLMFTDFQPSNVTIENNVISRIDGQGMKAEGTYGMPNLQVVNNTFTDTGTVNFRSSHPGAVVRNNIFQSVAELDSQPTVEHNLIVSGSSGGNYGARALVGDPGFVNAAGGDFELAAGSRAIDAGSAAGPAVDRLGRPRSDDPAAANRGSGAPSYVDIGAQARQTGVPGVALPGPPGVRKGKRNLRRQRYNGIRRRVARRRGIVLRTRVPRRHRALQLAVRRNGRLLGVARLRRPAKGRRTAVARVRRAGGPGRGRRAGRVTVVRRGPRRVGIKLKGPMLRRVGRYALVVRSGQSQRRVRPHRVMRFRIVR
jgi:hypothetical protein